MTNASFVQQIGKTTGNGLSSIQVVPASGHDTVSGNQIIVSVNWVPVSGSTYATCVISDSAGNTYTTKYSYAGDANGPACLVAKCDNATPISHTGGFIKATFTGPASFSIMMADELSHAGADDGSPVTNSGAINSATISLGSLPVAAGDIAYVVINSAGNLTATTWTSGWTAEFQSATPTLSIGYQTISSGGSVTGTATLRSAEPTTWRMFAFKDASGTTPATANGVTATSAATSPAGTVLARAKANGVTATATTASTPGFAGVSAVANGVTATSASASATPSASARAKANGVTALSASVADAGVVSIAGDAIAIGVTATSASASATPSASARAKANGVTANSVSTASAGLAGVPAIANGVTATSSSASIPGSATGKARADGVIAVSSSISSAGSVRAAAIVSGVTATSSSAAHAGSAVVSVSVPKTGTVSIHAVSPGNVNISEPTEGSVSIRNMTGGKVTIK